MIPWATTKCRMYASKVASLLSLIPVLTLTQGDTIHASTDRHSIVGMPGYPEYGDSAREMNTVAFNIQILNSSAL